MFQNFHHHLHNSFPIRMDLGMQHKAPWKSWKKVYNHLLFYQLTPNCIILWLVEESRESKEVFITPTSPNTQFKPEWLLWSNHPKFSLKHLNIANHFVAFYNFLRSTACYTCFFKLYTPFQWEINHSSSCSWCIGQVISRSNLFKKHA